MQEVLREVLQEVLEEFIYFFRLTSGTQEYTLISGTILCQTVGFIGSFFTSSSVSAWYPTLAKPPFNPPSWVFAPMWTILFLLMGVSLSLLWTNKDPGPCSRSSASNCS